MLFTRKNYKIKFSVIFYKSIEKYVIIVRMKKGLFFCLFLLISTCIFSEDFIDFPDKVWLPECKHEATDVISRLSPHEIHHYEGFSMCYREAYEQSEWVAYKLTKEDLVKNVARNKNFTEDLSISTGSAINIDYKQSGYDRGHLAPSADMCRNEKTQIECFMFSNISPQDHNMNSGIWANAESYARNMAKTYGIVYVVTGPLLEKPAMDYKSIGINKVSVPEYFYKIMLSPIDGGKKVRVFACIIPNKASDENLRTYSASIDEIEKRTGIDFFPLLEDAIENEIENLSDLPKTIKAHSE